MPDVENDGRIPWTGSDSKIAAETEEGKVGGSRADKGQRSVILDEFTYSEAPLRDPLRDPLREPLREARRDNVA